MAGPVGAGRGRAWRLGRQLVGGRWRDPLADPDVRALRCRAVRLPDLVLWAQYFTSGGEADFVELQAYLHGLLVMDDRQLALLEEAVRDCEECR